MKKGYTDAEKKLKETARSYQEGTKIVYQWVKQDKINPSVMANLMVFLWSEFLPDDFEAIIDVVNH